MTIRQKKVNIAIYGKLSKKYGGKHLAVFDISIPPDYHLGDLLHEIKIPLEETSFIFLDAVLCDVPGLLPEHNEQLNDGSHVGIFSKGYMYPYQYRDGLPMSEPLKRAMAKHGFMHHSYNKFSNQ